MNSFSDFPIPIFYTILIFLLNFDRFSWTNHRKRRPGRIPSQNRAKSQEKPWNICKMSMKILQKSTKLTYWNVILMIILTPLKIWRDPSDWHWSFNTGARKGLTEFQKVFLSCTNKPVCCLVSGAQLMKFHNKMQHCWVLVTKPRRLVPIVGNSEYVFSIALQSVWCLVLNYWNFITKCSIVEC